MAVSVVALSGTVTDALSTDYPAELSPGQSEYAERAERLLAAAIEAGDELGTARAQHAMARHMQALSLFPQALIHAELARSAAGRMADDHTRLAIDITYAAILAQLDRTAESTGILLTALEHARELEDAELQQRALLGLTSAYVSARQLEEARDFGLQGLALTRTSGDRIQEMRFLNNLGLIAHTAGDMETAKAYIAEALSVEAPSELPPDVHRALVLASITLSGSTGEENAARARELIQEARRDNSHYIEGFATEQLGQILCSGGETDAALEAFGRAAELLQMSDRLGDLARLHKRWAACLEAARQFRSALGKERQAIAYYDQVNERRRQETLQAHDVAFRTEQRMGELARLASEEQALQARIAGQRELTAWVIAGAVLLLGILIGLWFRNRRLREIRDAQAELQQARIDLLASTSHEIRNPTQGIIGILESNIGAHGRTDGRRLGDALAAARMVGHLANDYLDLALLEQGKFHIDREALCHLPRLVERVETLSTAFIKSPKQFLATRFDARLPEWIHADSDRLTQVLLNIISNAAYYTSSGEITLDVSLGPDQRTLMFEIADRGPGFDISDTGILNPYERGRHRRGNPRGSGLGLAISARIVSAMGGDITIRNRSSDGAALLLSFPLDAAGPPDTDQAVVEPAADTPSASPRVLIVDDDPFARLGLSALVESANGQVRELNSGRRLEDELDAFDPEFVLLDYRLGETTGTELAGRIRRWDQHNGKPRKIVIVSGTANDDPDTDVKIDAWLVKPVGRATIDKLLHGQ